MGFLRRLFGGKKPPQDDDPAEILRREFEIGVKAGQYGWGEYLKLAGMPNAATLAQAIQEYASTFRRIVEENLPFTADTIRETGREDHFWFILFTVMQTAGTHPKEQVEAAFLQLRQRGLIPRPADPA